MFVFLCTSLFQIIYLNFILEDGSLQKLSSVFIVDLQNPSCIVGHENSSLMEEIYQNVTNALTRHMSERQSRNPWSSQFEMPVYPWLLPCANFPKCETTSTTETDDFSDLVMSILDDG